MGLKYNEFIEEARKEHEDSLNRYPKVSSSNLTLEDEAYTENKSRDYEARLIAQKRERDIDEITQTQKRIRHLKVKIYNERMQLTDHTLKIAYSYEKEISRLQNEIRLETSSWIRGGLIKKLSHYLQGHYGKTLADEEKWVENLFKKIKEDD